MRDIPVDSSIMLLPGGPSIGNLDAIVDDDGDGHHNTGLEELDSELSHVEAEQLRLATQSPELYICDGWVNACPTVTCPPARPANPALPGGDRHCLEASGRASRRYAYIAVLPGGKVSSGVFAWKQYVSVCVFCLEATRCCEEIA